jgi:hypothetical protein
VKRQPIEVELALAPTVSTVDEAADALETREWHGLTYCVEQSRCLLT